MRCYIVGGAVRDELLGLPVKDRDWVVVGETSKTMLARGFRQVGRDFPVFLHPETHEEYALARTEKKTGRGYTGFTVHASPDITLEEDLARRDLTINAIARAQDGRLIDPHGGRNDLEARVFRHVGPAFAEDPVRILRLARFSARYPDFSVAPETIALMRNMVAAGEIDHLVPERVWQEISRGLMEIRPSRMIVVLRECGALSRLLPEVDCLFGIPQPEQYHPKIDTGKHVLMVIDEAAKRRFALAVRWACLLHDLGKGLTPVEILPHHFGHEKTSAQLAESVSRRLKAPAECTDIAVLVAKEHGIIGNFSALRPGKIVTVLERCDALRRSERFDRLLEACLCDQMGRACSNEKPPWTVPDLWRKALKIIKSIDAAAIAQACADKKNISAALHQARTDALKRHGVI